MKNLAIIPARSGSKGLANKNIRILNGLPMIGYSINAALESKQFSKVMVSTDSEEIAEIAISLGAEVPWLRPMHLATDKSKIGDTIEHVINEYNKDNVNFNTFCVLQPTSPLRTANNIIQAYSEYVLKNAVAIVSVCESSHSPLWQNMLPTNLSMTNFITAEVLNKNRQELPQYYQLNGAVYIANVNAYLSSKNYYIPGSYAYIMNELESIDVDSLLDFELCESILLKKKCLLNNLG